MGGDRYSMSFTTGALFHEASVGLAALYLSTGDWSAYQRRLEQLTAWAQTPPATASGGNKPFSGQGTATTEVRDSRIVYGSCRAVRVSFDKAWLANENDVERYLEAMREALMAEIRGGKRIQI